MHSMMRLLFHPLKAGITWNLNTPRGIPPECIRLYDAQNHMRATGLTFQPDCCSVYRMNGHSNNLLDLLSLRNNGGDFACVIPIA